MPLKFLFLGYVQAWVPRSIPGGKREQDVADNPTESIDISVRCHVGDRGEEEPGVIFFGQRAVAVEEVLDRWLAPDHRFFKVRGDDGARYIIRHDEREHRWELTFFDSLGEERQ